MTTRSRDVREQQVREREVAEVVGADLHLEAVGGPLLRDRHDAGVVDQHVEVGRPSRRRTRAPRRGRRGRARAPRVVPWHRRGRLLGRARRRARRARRARPRRASARAATRPMPLLAPVTTMVRPARSGRSVGGPLGSCHAYNVAADNKAVNANIEPLPSRTWPSRPAPITTATCAPRCSSPPSGRCSQQGAERALAARARAPGRRQPRRAAPPLPRQAGAARRARRGRLRAPRAGPARRR